MQVIARSSLNVRLNAETRLPALVQSAFVFSSVVFMSQIISLIPMPALSGMLIMTGMGMLNPAEFKHCYAVQKSDTVPFLATMGGMLSFGLAEGIGIGCLSALAMNYGNLKNGLAPTRLRVEQQLYQSTQHVNDKYNVPATMLDSKTVWKLTGPINFVSMLEIDNAMRQMSLQLQQQKDQPEPKMGSIVLDMADVTAVEFTGVEEVANRLVELSHEGGDCDVQMINCPDNLIRALAQCKLSPAISLFPAAAITAETEALMDGKKPAVVTASS
jgi:MFS superfamily sulfate permease-like transporter